MILHQPMCISARLLPAVKVDHEWISIEPTGRSDRDGKPEWRWFIDGPNLTAEGAELRGWGDARKMMASLCGFLGAAAEAYSCAMRTGRESDNADLISQAVTEWAYQNSDELGMIACELEESEGGAK